MEISIAPMDPNALVRAPGPAPGEAQSVSGSPWTYTNESSKLQLVVVTGNLPSLTQLSRDGAAFYGLSSNGGEYLLPPGSRLRLTYVLTPTVVVYTV